MWLMALDGLASCSNRDCPALFKHNCFHNKLLWIGVAIKLLVTKCLRLYNLIVCTVVDRMLVAVVQAR